MKITKENGFSTIELMISMAIIILVLTAVTMVSFGNQSFLSESGMSGEALNKARTMLEHEYALAKKDFKLVNTTGANKDDIYTESVTASTLPDFLTKKVLARVSWQSETYQNQSIELETLISNYTNPSIDTCDSTIAGDWTAPLIMNTVTDLTTLAGTSGTFPITDIDAYNGRLYMTTNNSSTNQPTFFIFDINSLVHNLPNPLIKMLDNDPLHNSGINAIAIDGNYAYIANASGISTGQLQIINLTTFAIKNFKVPGVTQGVGNSIYYRNGYVYLGLVSTGGHGSEFHIIDVRNPDNPVEVSSWPTGNASFRHDINEILVDGSYAYLATPDDVEELIVVDVNNTNTSYSYNAPGGSISSGNGRSLYKIGDTVYLGRTVISTNPEFYILNGSDPSLIQSNNLNPKSFKVGFSVNGLIVRDYLAYILTNNQFRVLNIENLSSITNWSPPLVLPGAQSSGGSSLDCEGNYLFSVTKTNGGIYIIGPKI